MSAAGYVFKFQFHKVRLKVCCNPRNNGMPERFQFHKVRLKGLWRHMYRTDFQVSIPQGTIKRARRNGRLSS